MSQMSERGKGIFPNKPLMNPNVGTPDTIQSNVNLVYVIHRLQSGKLVDNHVSIPHDSTHITLHAIFPDSTMIPVSPHISSSSS